MKKMIALLFALVFAASAFTACGADPCDEFAAVCGKCTDTGVKTSCEAAQKVSAALPIGRDESCKTGKATYEAQCQ